MILENTVDPFRNELQPGERIVWSGQPQQGFVFRPTDALLIPFTIVWSWCAVSGSVINLLNGVPYRFSPVEALFALVALYILFGRFLVDIALRRKTWYALTNERILIRSGLFTQNMKSIVIHKLSEININTKGDGRGTITFGSTHSMNWLLNISGFPNSHRYPPPPSFELIENARMVYEHVQRAQRAQREDY